MIRIIYVSENKIGIRCGKWQYNFIEQFPVYFSTFCVGDTSDRKL